MNPARDDAPGGVTPVQPIESSFAASEGEPDRCGCRHRSWQLPMIKNRYIALIVVLAAFGVFVPWCVDWWRVDACLDQGGRWIEAEDRCDFLEDVPSGE